MNLERYSRFRILPSIGLEGQKSIFKSRIGIFGLGGLGSWSSLLLTQLGVGYLRLIDRDVVEYSNLARTPIYNDDSVDLPKAEQAALFLRKLNPDVVIEELSVNIDQTSISNLVKDLDVVIDGLDNLSTRFIINKECRSKNIPYIFAGAIGTSANISSFLYKKDQPCLSCFFQQVNDDDLEKCDVLGVHSALLAIVASIQVAECIKVLLNQTPVLTSKLQYIHLETLDFDIIPLKQNKSCEICFPDNKVKKEVKNSIIELCGDKTFLIPKNASKKLNMQEIVTSVEGNNFKIMKKGSLGLTFEYETDNMKIFVSIFSNGNMLIRGESDKEKVLKIYNELLNIF